jgi:hypothetical protein
VTSTLAVTLLALGGLGAFVAGLVGVGGAIVVFPLLLYVPPAIGVGALTVKAVTGVTMVQVLVASLSGVLAHRRHNAVDLRLTRIGGASMATGSLTGAVLSSSVPDRWLLLVFALMVTAAVILLAVPVAAVEPAPLERGQFSAARTALVSAGVGIAAGLVGAGGAFLLVPLLLVVVRVPIRTTIGSSLAITALAAVAGVTGKLATGQVPYGAAVVVACGAALGAQAGAACSRRLSGSQLRLALGLITTAIAVHVWWNVLAPGG